MSREVHVRVCERLGVRFPRATRLALFADSKQQFWDWKRAIIDRLAGLRLTLHENVAQVAPVTSGIPWLGFVGYPTHWRVKARKVVQGTRRLTERFDAWRAGRISFAEFDASVNGWINHVLYADSWGLREHVLKRFVWGSQRTSGRPAGNPSWVGKCAQPRFARSSEQSISGQ